MLDMSNLIPAGTVDQPLWVSGGSYTIGQQVVSPANFNSYVRKTNGAGATDPRGDTTNWKPFGIHATKFISGKRHASGISLIDGLTSVAGTGTFSAGVLYTAFSRGGAGYMHNLSVYVDEATSRTMQLKITIDGVVVFDVSQPAVNAIGDGFLISGQRTETAAYSAPKLTWTNSILIEWSSSNTEAGSRFNAQYMYEDI